MTATLAPSPWPAPADRSPGGAFAFAREVRLAPDGSGPATAPRMALQWMQRRNCSITPRALLAVYGSLCAVSLAIGVAFYFQGAPFVLGFAGLELLLVGLAMLVFARHAGDRETLTLVGSALLVEQRSGARTERITFAAQWLRIEPAAGQGSLVELSGEGRQVRVGRFLRPDQRAAFARELRLALRRPLTELPRSPEPN